MADEEDRTLLAAVWSTKLYRCLLILLIYSFGFATVIPYLPTLFTNYFASTSTGHAIDCEAFPAGKQPPACVDAHSTVVQWSSWTSLVSNTFLTFLCAPMVGDLSDTLGRKPFLIAAFVLATLPVMVVVAYLVVDIPLLWYYPVSAISGVVSSIVIMLSYTADVLRPKERTAGFGLVVAAFALGFMVGPQLARVVTAAQAAWVAFGCCIAAILLTVLFVPESLPPSVAAASGTRSSRRATIQQRAHPVAACMSLGKSWALINSCSLFQKLALCVAITGIVSEGIQDLLVQYLQLVVGFNTADQALLFTIIGAANLVVQAFLLPVLAPRWGEQRLLLVGLILSCVEQSLLAVVTTKGQALGAISLGALAGVAYPAISAIKANMCGADQQGLVQGALAGIRALASGLGPLAFAQVFSMTTRTGSEFGYHPSAVLWVSCGLTAVAVVVAATVPSDAGRCTRQPVVVYRAVRSSASGEDVEGCSSSGGTTVAPAGAAEAYQAPGFQAAAINVRVVGEVGKERVNSILVRDVNLDAVQREYSLPVKRRDSD